jgi:hypothetical protein
MIQPLPKPATHESAFIELPATLQMGTHPDQAKRTAGSGQIRTVAMPSYLGACVDLSASRQTGKSTAFEVRNRRRIEEFLSLDLR